MTATMQEVTGRQTSLLDGVLLDTKAADSVEDAVRIAGLDFNVETEPVVTKSGLELPSNQAIVSVYPDGLRHPLGVVGRRYQPIQNSELLEPLDYLMNEGFITEISSAGSIDYGKRVIVIAKLSSECRLEDPHHRSIMFATGHDGTVAATVRGWSERMTCKNQIPAVFRGRGYISRIRHTMSGVAALPMLRDAVLAAIQNLDKYDEAMEQLLKHEATLGDEVGYVERLFPMPIEGTERQERYVDDKRNTVLNLMHADTNRNIEGTAAAMYQAAVEYHDYFSRGNRARRVLTGNDTKFKVRALELAQEFVLAA
jgi:phage/plasmid-like protein (TIGR03299 family)